MTTTPYFLQQRQVQLAQQDFILAGETSIARLPLKEAMLSVMLNAARFETTCLKLLNVEMKLQIIEIVHNIYLIKVHKDK